MNAICHICSGTCHRCCKKYFCRILISKQEKDVKTSIHYISIRPSRLDEDELWNQNQKQPNRIFWTRGKTHHHNSISISNKQWCTWSPYCENNFSFAEKKTKQKKIELNQAYQSTIAFQIEFQTTIAYMKSKWNNNDLCRSIASADGKLFFNWTCTIKTWTHFEYDVL